jgi:hypothetical protein
MVAGLVCFLALGFDVGLSASQATIMPLRENRARLMERTVVGPGPAPISKPIQRRETSWSVFSISPNAYKIGRGALVVFRFVVAHRWGQGRPWWIDVWSPFRGGVGACMTWHGATKRLCRSEPRTRNKQLNWQVQNSRLLRGSTDALCWRIKESQVLLAL